MNSYLSTPTPRQIVCAILTFQKHVVESIREHAGRSETEQRMPQFILKSPSSITANESPVILPDLRPTLKTREPWGWVSGEVELAVFMGREAHRIPAEKVSEYIDGYSILNDVTQRDLQTRGFPHSMAKSFPTFAPMGPRLVPKDEISSPESLRMVMRVNGRVVQDSKNDRMVYTVAELVSWASRIFRLRKGDVVTTGTPEGSLSYALKPGDIMEAEIEKIGVLRNPVVFHSLS